MSTNGDDHRVKDSLE
ncbi:interferon-induced protein with tetratricopeptide repeats 1 [Pongo abelii]|uniref:Uncharacterized protein DKFZp469C2331 n=1 Tax=Pongo abelii TaxID=9601 RepID=Q5R5B9_PONAB|nr:interferon-induced protein with tetratricopeptide repeats 1 [Pongo abelii]CAH93047.1 hypothetical protein [Pongo abelii]